MDIRFCPKLTYLVSSSSTTDGHGHDDNSLLVFSSQKDALLQLEMLTIEHCEMMEEIFSFKENKKDGRDQSHHQIITFPKLRRLELRNLKNLTTFSKGIESIEFPLLTEMDIQGCPKLTSLVSPSSSSYTEAHGHDDNSLHLFCSQRVTFGSLKDLKIGSYDNINNIWCRQIPLGFFNILENLKIVGCNGIKSLFSSSIVGEFVNLKQLAIMCCDEMEKVIGDEENLCEKSSFARLEQLGLHTLPKLKSFCESSCDFELPSLRIVNIYDCPQMKIFTMGSLSTSIFECASIDGNKFEDMRDLNDAIQLHLKANDGHDHDDNSLHWFCSQRATFGSLKYLDIGCYDNINNIWCRQISLGFFNILEELKIVRCNGIKSLFSSSIVGEFVNLKQLTIMCCDEMEKVIGDEENLCEKSSFPRLERLEIRCLKKLRSFCEWSCDFELPSLRRADIYDCPQMKIFTMGSLNTPKFLKGFINENKFEDIRDLNGSIQLHLRADEESTSSLAKGEGASNGEGQEDKGEIKEKEIGEIVEVMGL